MWKLFNNDEKCKFFTLIELLIVISIIVILCAILLPALSKAREKVRGAACMSNCKQIGVALLQYSSDFDGWHLPSKLPYVSFWSGLNSVRPWFDALGKFREYSPLDYGVKICSLGNSYYRLGDGKIMCPSQNEYDAYTYTDYIANRNLFGDGDTYAYHKLSQIKQPSISKEVLDNSKTGDYRTSYVCSPGVELYINFRHVKRTNVLYSDTHVESKSLFDMTSTGTHSGATELRQGFCL